MFFDSAPFFFFVIAVVPLGWLLEGRPKQVFLLGASYLFYGWWDWRFLGLILLSTLIDFVASQRIEAQRAKGGQGGGQGRGPMLFSVISQLLILGYFKYANFFLESLNLALSTLGMASLGKGLSIVLPVGISFYTFQTMSYTIDVYRGRLRAERDLLVFALFVSWFPQLVAGPIERAQRLLPQLKEEPRLDPKMLSSGLMLIVWGLFKKMVIADRAAQIATAVFGASQKASALEWYAAALAFALQIYGDFSGYSDIARGLSRLFGIELMLNFKHPYFALGPQDFWRRWHRSLSFWLRDYLYIALGGNRRGTARTYVNLILTMLLGGLWHGAAWHFVAWGLYHGVLLAIERALGWARSPEALWARLGRVAVMFQLTLFGWILFRIQSLAQLGDVLGSLGRTSANPGQLMRWSQLLGLLWSPVLMMQLYQLRTGSMEVLEEARWPIKALFVLFCFVMVLLFRVPDRVEFIYFQF